MPSVTLRPRVGVNGGGTTSFGGWQQIPTMTLEAAIEDDPDSPDSSYTFNQGTGAHYKISNSGGDLVGIPADLGSVTDITVRVYCEVANVVDDTLLANIQILKANGALAAETGNVIGGGALSAALRTYSMTMTATGLAMTKSDWDFAYPGYISTYTASMGADSGSIRIYALEWATTYTQSGQTSTAAPTDTRDTGTAVARSQQTGPPVNVVATAVSGTQINLTWNAYLGAKGYDIYRNNVRIAKNHQLPKYSDTGLTAATAYSYRVTAMLGLEVPITDSFNRANSAVTLGTTDTGEPWVPNSGTWGIDANRAYNTYTGGTGQQNTTIVETSVSDCTVQFTQAVAGDMGVCFRSTDDSNNFITNNTDLFRKQAGSFTNIGTIGTWANGDVMKATLSGSSLTIYKNGTSVLATTDSFQSTATKHGLRFNTILSGAARFDDFSVTVPPTGLPPVTDSFNRANSTTTMGTADTGHTWLAEAQGTGVIGIDNNQAIMSPQALSFYSCRARPQMSDLADTDVIVAFTMDSTALQYPSVQVRTDTTWDADNYGVANNGYRFQWTVTGNLFLIKTVAGTDTTLTQVAPPTPTTTKWWVRVQAIGTTIRSRLWADGTSEPATWDMSVVDTTFTSGKVVLSTANNVDAVTKTVRWDSLHVSDPTVFVPPTGFAPTDIAGLTGWWDASDAATITSSGGLVSQWNDKSTAARHATASGTARPTTGTRTINALNTLDFDGSLTSLAISSIAIGVGSPVTAFVVVSKDGVADRCVVLSSTTNGNSYVLTHRSATSGVAEFVLPSTIAASSTTSASAASTAVLRARHDGAVSSSGLSMAINSAAAGTGNAAAGVAEIWDRIASYSGGGTFNLDGRLAEIVIYNTALSTAAIASVEAYLLRKWLNLPATDSFNRADSTTTMGTTTTGQTWVPNSGTWGIIGNRAYAIGASVQWTTVIEAGVSDCSVQMTYAVVEDAGVVLRSTDDNNNFVTNSTIGIYRRQSGAYTQLGTYPTQFVTGDVQKVVMSGSSITVYKNGVSHLAVTDSFNSTATKHGLRTNNATAARFDDFSVSVTVPEWTPANLPSLAGWWDASDASTFSYSSGVLVSQWNDKSGSARHFSQATVTNQPSRNGTQKGLDTVVFDGIDNYMDTGAFTLTQPMTLIVVKQSLTTSTDRAMVSSVGGSLQTYVSASNTQVRMEAGAGVSIGATAPVRGLHIYGFTFNGATSLAYQDGVLLGTLASSPGTAGTTTGLRISERNLATWFDGEIMEIIATDDVLSAGDWASVHAYLQSKWTMIPITDSFNRADSTTTMGTTTTGQTWVALSGTWGISTNKAYCVSAADNNSAVVDAGVTDLTVVAVLDTSAGRQPGVVVRAADNTNYYLTQTDSSLVQIYKEVAGAYTLIASAGAFASGDTMAFTVAGSALTAKVNGVTQASGTDSSLTTGTKAGIRQGGSAGALRWDDFSVTVT